jgi:hypothetical protein
MIVMQLASAATSAALAARTEFELSLVPAASPAERARQLMQEARAAALDHLQALQQSMGATRSLAETVAANGDLYGAGLQDLARRLAEELEWRAKTLDTLIERRREAGGGRRLTLQGQAS